jgi:hypothetical protein
LISLVSFSTLNALAKNMMPATGTSATSTMGFRQIAVEVAAHCKRILFLSDGPAARARSSIEELRCNKFMLQRRYDVTGVTVLRRKDQPG